MGKTALLVAAKSGSFEVLKALLKNKADISKATAVKSFFPDFHLLACFHCVLCEEWGNCADAILQCKVHALR